MKTLLAIVSCAKYAARVDAQCATWVPLLLGAGYDVQVFDGPRLDVPDDYMSLPAKTKALCAWALANGYERMLKMDDDSYVRASKFSIVEQHYAGIRIPAHDGWDHDYASGGAYWMSGLLMQAVAGARLDDWAEDRHVGQVAGRSGIPLFTLPAYVIADRQHRWHHDEYHVKYDDAVVTQLNESVGVRACHALKEGETL